MSREQLKAGITGAIVTAILAAAIVLGSRNLRHIDAALVGYTFACLFAVFGLAYRYSMWLQRPPTRMHWNRGWGAFLRPGRLSISARDLAVRLVSTFALNLFIFKRGRSRGLAHVLIMWGCVLAAAITFPLVFGWVHFETVPGDLSLYQTYVFGFPTMTFRHEGPLGHLIFHGLVWASFLVIPGSMIAVARRLRDHAAAASQDLREDLMPLFLLFAISATGLLLTVSYTWMKGYAYEFLSILHAATVIFTLLWLPFGKFFHIFQRPAQLGVTFYKDAGKEGEQAKCARCGCPYAPKIQIDDLITVERQLGYRYDMPGDPSGHYQRICPPCRRKMLALAQGRLFAPVTSEGSSDGQ
jgi:hypothetical protein